jgi:hypothetical protein
MPTITKDGAYFVGGKEVTKSVYDAELAKRKSTGFAAPKPGQPGEYGTTGASQGNKPVLTEQGGRYYIDGQEVAKVTWDKARSNAAASGDAGMFRKIVSGQSIPTGPMLGGQDGRGIEADPRGTAPASGTQHAGGTAGFDEKTGQYIDPQTGKLLPKGVKPTDSQRKFTAVTDAQGNVTIPGTDIVIPPAVVKSMAEKGISLQPPTKTAATTTTQKATDLSKGRSAAPVAARPAQPSTNSKWDGALQKWIVESSGKKGADMVWNADKQKWTPQSKAITKKQRTAASKSKPLKVGSPEWAASVRSGSL